MNRPDKAFSEEYSDSGATESRARSQDGILDQVTETPVKDEYQPAKPHRIVIRARTIHD